jgi:hypothetical protein
MGQLSDNMISPGGWYDVREIESKAWRCGHCDRDTGNNKGYAYSEESGPRIYICPICGEPTYFLGDKQVPGVAYGRQVDNLPPDIAGLYTEARNCMSVNAYTAAVLACRKMLMNIAVQNGAKEGESFGGYVAFLDAAGYVPPKGKGWVDYIRQRGNEANHAIALMGRKDAESLIEFIEMLLRFNFDFPAKVPTP